MATILDPENYRRKADADRGAANAWPASTPRHSEFNAGWDVAVHKGPRSAGDRKSPAWLKGLVSGYSWRRRNPAA